MKIQGKIIDDEQLACVRLRFERYCARRSGAKRPALPAFDELLGYYANDCMSFRDIEEIVFRDGKCGRASRLYYRYIASLFPSRKDGRKRRKICTLKRRQIAKREAARDFSDEEVLLRVGQAAAAAGCTVQREVKLSSRRLFRAKHTVLLNGLVYSVHYCKKASMARSVPYSRVTLTKEILKRTDGVIVLREWKGPEQFFVIPSQEILAAYGEGGKPPYFTIYIPTDRRPVYRNNTPRLDWWQYENAWPPPVKEKIVVIPPSRILEAIGAGK